MLFERKLSIIFAVFGVGHFIALYAGNAGWIDVSFIQGLAHRVFGAMLLIIAWATAAHTKTEKWWGRYDETEKE